ncbi:TraM recognition domain-containing protein [Rummeliibacillus stabekisii]|uniref:TraM recognition domain-containing protein n=1 Tax=Rummeliibacillus stabekisii TaxID=241244 RepID=UPI00203F9F7A|nr:TraM recognition domain-containing protein [Rummeliibacillus stabekisii]MCM3317962.1 TraM recognition domain-containing protein [Rummeliibacillus stabekisii]
MSSKEEWIKRFPKILASILAIVSTYAMLRSIFTVFSIAASHYRNTSIHLLSFIFGKSEGVSIYWLIAVGGISVFGWLLSTRVKSFQNKWIRLYMFMLPLISIAASLVGYGMTLVRRSVFPFFEERLENVIDTNEFIHQILFEQVNGFFFMLIMLPFIVLMFVGMFVSTKYLQHDEEFKKAFFDYQWKGELLRKFSNMEGEEMYPYIELGINKETNEMVVLPGFDRTLNTVVVGTIGTGKSAAYGLPTLNQDLHHLTRFINAYPKISKSANFKSKEVLGRYLNGITVVEPSNDLCQKVYSLCKAHNIPDEAITYIDPTNPDTPSINPMRGPVDKVAEVFTQVIAGLSDSGDGGNFFFEQAQRVHLKQHIYLLKMHEPDKDVTFDMLLEMYENTSMVHEMHKQLKKRFPEEIENIEDRDERNYWKILKGIDDWFTNNYAPAETSGYRAEKVRDSDGNIVYEDLQAKNVQGLRNILNDIGSNPLIRRVLFGHSDFDFDEHMRKGGILLVNTAKGSLEALNSVLGKIVLMTLQNASFRREPEISAFHHLLVDEVPEYLYNSFRSYPAQSRKYKVIITILQQSLTQSADAFGEFYMTTIIAAMRNRVVFGDLPAYDAEYFSKIFGEKYVYQEGESEQSVSPLQDNPSSRSGSTYSKVLEQNLTAGGIMYQEAFECSVKIVVNNQPIPVQQIKANFVPREEFEKAIITVDEAAATYWLQDEGLNGINPKVVDTDIQSVEETEVINQIHYEQEIKRNTLNMETVERAVSIYSEPRPNQKIVRYDQKQVRIDENTRDSQPSTLQSNNIEEDEFVIDIAPTPVKVNESRSVNEDNVIPTTTSINIDNVTESSTKKSKVELLFKKEDVVENILERSSLIDESAASAVEETIHQEAEKPASKPVNPLLQKHVAAPNEEETYTVSTLDNENDAFLKELKSEIK